MRSERLESAAGKKVKRRMRGKYESEKLEEDKEKEQDCEFTGCLNFS